jgi:hypothetical protein
MAARDAMFTRAPRWRGVYGLGGEKRGWVSVLDITGVR